MKVLQLGLSVLIAYSAGMIGSLFNTPDAMIWYSTIIKPSLTPPSWVFGPVWLALYILMGFAAYLIWQKRSLLEAKAAFVIYVIHLFFNALWSILFFGLRSPGFAFIDIIILKILIVLTILLFWRVNKWAGILLIPYFLWVSFAVYLNFMIWQLN